MRFISVLRDPGGWVFVAALFVAAGCDDSGPQDAADCLPSFGDHCDCDPKCMTQEEIDSLTAVCDLDCGDPDWSCDLEAGSCIVDEGSE